MKHAFVTSSVSRQAGGLFFSVRSLATALDALDPGRVAIHGLEDSNTAVDLRAWAHLRTEIHTVRGARALGWSPGMSKALVSSNYELLHTQGIWQWPSAAVHHWHRRSGRPYLVSPRGMLDPWALARSRWKKRFAEAWYETAHLRDAACIHALCQSEADSIRAYGLKNPVCVIPNGINLPPDRDQGTGVRNAERALANLENYDAVVAGMAGGNQVSGRKTLVFLGRLHPKKGLVNALRAWKQVLHSTSKIQNSKFDEWQFVVAGWNQNGHEAELKRLCKELGLAYAETPAAEFVGDVEELSVVRCRLSDELDVGALLSSSSLQMPDSRLEQGASARTTDNRQPTTDNNASVVFLGPAFGDTKDLLLRQASAFILPSFSEGLPMSVLEAWSYRLPVLMTDQCNLPEGFSNNAALRIGTDVESIAEGMRLLTCSLTPDLCSLGANGRALVERQFTWPQVAAQMKEVYEWVLGGGEVPDCVRRF